MSKIGHGAAAMAMGLGTLVIPVTAASAGSSGTTQIAGVGYPGPGLCNATDDGVLTPVDYIVVMTGDLEGCLYQDVDEASIKVTNGGTYQEHGTEIFVSGANSDDWFTTSYHYTAKFTDAGQQYGRCQHPITAGGGRYEGATGRLDFKDTIVDGVAVCFVYRGHIRTN